MSNVFSNWHDLGEITIDSPSAVGSSSTSSRRVDVFFTDDRNMVIHAMFDGEKLASKHEVGGPVSCSPSACRLNNELHVFVRGTNNELYHKSERDNFSTWDNVSSILNGRPTLSSSPSAFVANNDTIHVFFPGSDNRLYHIWSQDGQTWTSDPQNLSGSGNSNLVNGSSSEASSGTNRLDLLARGADNSLYYSSCDASSSSNPCNWSSWRSISGTLSSSPSAISRNNEIDVYFTGRDNHLMVTSSSDQGRTWSNPQDLGGGPILSSPAAASSSRDQIDIFARGTDNHLYHRSSSSGRSSNNSSNK
ncbi:MAG: hypothetical protein ACM3SY_12325 [Candidatus Omnitrophota bacterium]